MTSARIGFEARAALLTDRSDDAVDLVSRPPPGSSLVANAVRLTAARPIYGPIDVTSDGWVASPRYLGKPGAPEWGWLAAARSKREYSKWVAGGT